MNDQKERENFYSLLTGAYPELAVPILRERPEFANDVCGEFIKYGITYKVSDTLKHESFSLREIPAVFVPRHKRFDHILEFNLVVYLAYDPHEWLLERNPRYRWLYFSSDRDLCVSTGFWGHNGYYPVTHLDGGLCCHTDLLHHQRIKGNPLLYPKANKRALPKNAEFEDYDPAEYYPLFMEDARKHLNRK